MSWLVGSLVFGPALFALAWLLTPLGAADALFVVLLTELLPVMAVAQLPLVQKEEPLSPIPIYLSSGVAIVLLGWAALALGGRRWGLEQMGLGAVAGGRLITMALALFVGGIALMLAFLKVRKKLRLEETRVLVQLLPRTAAEKTAFAALSVGAGLGEELAYRGYLIPALTLLLGWDWGAALVSSVAFGVLHAYQGWLGMLRTGVLGLALAASFLAWGILWPAVVAHVALDLAAGLVLGDRLVKG